MKKHERRWTRCGAVLAASLTAFAARTAAAQDPPPPDEPPPETPQPPPPPDVPPKRETPAAPPPAVPTPPPPEGPSEPAHGSARTLRGHRFITPFLLNSAIVESNLGLGVEIGRQFSPAYPGGGQTSMSSAMHDFSYDRALGATAMYASFGIAVTNAVELGVSATYATLMGGDPQSALLYGSRNDWELKPGARFRFVKTQTTQLALNVYGDFGSGVQLEPGGVLLEIANEAAQIGADQNRANCLASGDLGCTITNKMFNAQTAMGFSSANYGGGATLSLAHAFTSTFGLQAALGLDAGYETTTAGSNTYGSVPVNFHVGLAPSLDFGANVPIGIMAEYLFSVRDDIGIVTETLDSPTLLTLHNGFVLGVYYTGRENLSVGALLNASIDEVTTTFGADSSSMTTPTGKQPYTRVAGQITARYYF
jgi:hypothetical protein